MGPAQGEGSWGAVPFPGNTNSMAGPDTREYFPQQETPRQLCQRVSMRRSGESAVAASRTQTDDIKYVMVDLVRQIEN